MNPIDEAIEIVGWDPLAKALSVTKQAVRKWRNSERLPRTELTGETSYARTIQDATGGKVSAEALLEWTRLGWTSNAA